MYKDPFEIRQNNGVPYLFIPLFENTGKVKTVFSTRLGGKSAGYFSSMNLGLNRGDCADKVKENFALLCKSAGIDKNRLVFTAQTHTANVLTVTAGNCGYGFTQKGFSDIDALVTDVPNVFLTAFFADCVPLYFLDTVKGVCAIAHAGWRGTSKRIAENTLSVMINRYKCKPCDILAAVGPSVCSAHYEVSKDVAKEIAEGCKCKDAVFFEKGKWYADLKKANKAIMESCGLLSGNIAVTNQCTACRTDRYFSHRIYGDKRGSHCAIIGLI